MNYNVQKTVLTTKCPKHQEINDLIFVKNADIHDSTANNDYNISPITRALLNLYQYYDDKAKEITVSYTKWNYSEITSYIQNNNNNFDQIANKVFRITPNTTQLYIVHITKGHDMFDTAKAHPGYNANASLALQTEQSHRIAVVKISDTATIILTNKYFSEDAQVYFSLVPIVFSRDKLPDTLINAFLALAELDYDTIVEYLNEIYGTIDTQTAKDEQLKINLNKVLSNKMALQSIDSDLNNSKAVLQDHYDSIVHYLTKIKELEYKRLAVANISYAIQIDEFMAFIKANKFIETYRMQSNTLVLTIKTPIFFFDEELLKRTLEKSESYINVYSNTTIKHLVKEIFVEKKYNLNVNAVLSINMGALEKVCNGRSGTTRLTQIVTAEALQETQTSVPQPHIVNYRCYGGNENHILKAIQNNDLIAFIAQTIAACQNLNFGDTGVIQNLFKMLTMNYPNVQCMINNETNELLSYKQWLEVYNETNKD